MISLALLVLLIEFPTFVYHLSFLIISLHSSSVLVFHRLLLFLFLFLFFLPSIFALSFPYSLIFSFHRLLLISLLPFSALPDIRLKFLTLLMLFVLSISITVTTCRFGFGILEDNFVASLNTTYRSSAQFMCFYGLLNFYLYTMAYVYSPDGRFAQAELAVTKDNPAISMIDDSDEDVVYGSDEESRRPLTSVGGAGKNDYDSD